jgi:hypothetical protein
MVNVAYRGGVLSPEMADLVQCSYEIKCLQYMTDLVQTSDI